MLIYLQNLILEMVARGEELRPTVERLCREVERLSPDAICSVLAVDDDGTLRHLASPSLPKHVSDAIDGVKIGPTVGSCGTAAYFKREVSVVDIDNDPLWADFKGLVLPIGLRACWSSPIVSASGLVGTFAFYYKTNRGPTEFERDIVAKCLQLCQIAFDGEHRVRLHERLLYTDTLTGLNNRACFEQAVMDGSPGGTALLLIDIDYLKMVNDTFGHATGDCLIRIVAERLVEAAAPHRAFRIGGDELAVLADAASIVPLAHHILDALSQPADCDGHMMAPGITIGVAIRPVDDHCGAVMRQNADLALYHGKEDGGRGTLVLYTPELRTRMNRRLHAIDQLRRALIEGRVEAHYQPIARLQDGEVLSFEALARIRQPGGATTAAAEFEQGFADARNAVEVTRLMLRTVAADLRRWLDAGLAVGRVAINLAPADFSHGQLVDNVRAAFAAVNCPLSHLTLEITESVYLKRGGQRIHEQAEQLRRLGVAFALDDFGTGYASLTHLLSIPVDMLKIDKSFVDRLADDADGGGSAVINGLMRIAEKLKIEVVAEGVETIGQREQLVALGCRLGQGRLFADALEHNEVAALLAQGPACLPETALPTSLRARNLRRRQRSQAA